MEDTMTSLKNSARLAGFLYLVMILSALYSHMYVPLQLWVKGDALATTRNILDHETLFRTCILVNLIGAIIFLFLALNLDRLLRKVDPQLSRIMMVLVHLQVPVIFVLAIFKLTALMLLKSGVSSIVATDQLPHLAMLFLEMNGYGSMILGLFAGLWLIPFGMLTYRSKFIPRVLGILLITAGAGYALTSVLAMTVPVFSAQAQMLPFIFFALGEVPIMLWLLIKGIREHVSVIVISETKTTIRPSNRSMKEYIDH